MINIRTLSDIEALSESVDLECKLAAGKTEGDSYPSISGPPTAPLPIPMAAVSCLVLKKRKDGSLYMASLTQNE